MNSTIGSMEQKVKVLNQRRRYDASRRQAAAEQTRLSIVAAAREHFLERGYAKTTMAAIASEAGVALDTVYATVGTKPALFRLLIELAISGSGEPVPALERDYVKEINAEPDPRLKIERYGRAVRQIATRLAPLFAVLSEAARSDPELAALWREIAERRARNMRLFVAEVASVNGLRQGVSIDDGERGWDSDKYERWLTDLWVRMLLP
jgi:AcrR family transcriptional regulator